MKKYLYAIPDLCTGCNRCVLACSALKEGKFMPSRARIQINNITFNGYSVPSICFQCPKPDCQKACPEDAIYKNDDDIVLIDRERCTGCGECVDACPYGMIEQDENEMAYKCDYCGGDPSCVKQCYFDALVFQEVDKDLRKIRGKQMKQRIQTGSPSEKRHQLGLNLTALARQSA